MNFGQNLYNWFLSNAQSLVLLAIVVIGLYLGFKREFSKLIGFLIIAIIAVGLVFNAAGVKDILLGAIQSHYWCLNKTVLLWNISGFLMFRKGMVHQTKCGRDFESLQRKDVNIWTICKSILRI